MRFPCSGNEHAFGNIMEPKRQRTAYTRHQILELEKEFHFNRFVEPNRLRPRVEDPRDNFLFSKVLSIGEVSANDSIAPLQISNETTQDRDCS